MGGQARRASLLVLIVLLGLLIAAPAFAGDTVSVDVTMENAVVSISIDRTAWNAGALPLRGWAQSPPFSVSNDGNSSVDLWVHGYDATQTGGAGVWTLLSDGAQSIDTDEYRIDLFPNYVGGQGMVVPRLSPVAIGQQADNIAAGGTFDFFLTLYMPSGVTDRGSYSTQVVLTATEN